MKTHKDLEVWKQSVEMVTTIYRLTQKFPKEELYGLSNQMRRAAVSVASNIAEGAGRNSDKEFVQFLYIAMGSLSELDTQITIACNLGFINAEEKQQMDEKYTFIVKMLSGLITFVKNKTNH